MKNHIISSVCLELSVSILALLLLTSVARVSAQTTTASAATKEAIEAFRLPERGLTNYFNTAKGYAVFPEIAKGGLVFGGAHGTGEVFVGAEVIGRAKVTQVTFGAQIGGQVYSEIIFFETSQALDDFKASKLKVSAQVSGVAAAEGGARTAKYHQGVAVFTLPKQGLMGEASVGGQKFTFEAVVPEPAK